MSELASDYGRDSSALHASQEILAGIQFRTAGKSGPKIEDPYESGHDSKIIQLPLLTEVEATLSALATQEEVDVETVSPEPARLNLPPTTLETHEVKLRLETRNTSTPDDRIQSLLDYAWDSTSIIERPVPAELIPYLRIRPGEWYKQNKKLVDLILQVRGHSKHDLRYEAEDIEEETQKFNRTPFIRNTETIRSVSWHRHDGVKVVFAARMMLHQADRAFREGVPPQD